MSHSVSRGDYIPDVVVAALVNAWSIVECSLARFGCVEIRRNKTKRNEIGFAYQWLVT